MKIKCGPKDHHKIPEGSPKDETQKLQILHIFYIYTTYIYTFCRIFGKNKHFRQ